MAENLSVTALLSAKDNGFTSTMKGAQKTVGGLGSSLGGIKFGILSGVGTAAFNAVKTSVSGLISEINSSSAAWKTFEGNMSMLDKSTKEINSTKKELQDFATQTVYSASDMATTYSQLAAVGTKNTTKLVKGFGGLAAAAENPQQAMKTLSQQGVQMAAKPTVAWQDFKLMLEQSPAGMAAVAKSMGMTTSELVTKIQDGEVATKDFFNAIQKVGTNKDFTKLATTYKTVGQAMDGLQETIGTKLQPAFAFLSDKAISGISGIVDALSSINGNKVKKQIKGIWNTFAKVFGDSKKEAEKITLGDKVISGLEKVQTLATKLVPYITAIKTAFSGVGSEVWGAVKEVASAMGLMGDSFGSADSVSGFKSAMQSVADGIKSVAGFVKEHKDTIATLIKWLPAIVIGFKGFGIAKTVAPAVMSFGKGIASLAGKGISGIAAKLFGISGAQKTVGKSSAASSKQMLASAKSLMMMGAGVLMIAAGFALLAQSAIALSSAGGGAIAIMAGLVIAVAALSIGMLVLLKSVSATPKKMQSAAMALLAMGAAVLLIGLGFALLTQSSIALAAAGWGAIAVMVGMVAVIALLAVGASMLGASLTAGALGFIAFGAAVLLVGAGFALIGVAAMLAANALTIVASVLPLIIANGLQGAVAIGALGLALATFAIGAALAAPALLVLSAALLVAGAGMLLLGTGALLASLAISLIALQLPTLANYGTQSAVALLALGASMAVFAAGAILAGAACIVLGAGLILVGAGLLVVGAGLLVVGAGALLAVAALMLLSVVMPTIAAYGTQCATATLLLGASLLVFGAGAIVAGAGALVAAAGVTVFGAGMLICAAGTLVMVAAIKALNTSMKSIAKNAKSAENSLKTMQKSVDVVEAGLKGLGNIVKSAMSKLTSAFSTSAGKVKASAQKLGTGAVKGFESGIKNISVVSTKATLLVAVALMGGQAKAYQAGTYISMGFARGMTSQLGIIEAAANRMVAAADKAIRAKAKIHSPSDLTYDDGHYMVLGLENSLLDGAKRVWNAAKELVSIPQVATPDLALAYEGALSEDYRYSNSSEYVIEVPLNIDGKQVAKATATYTQDELNKMQKRESRKKGKA